VKIFATVKIYKKYVNLNGAKLIPVNDNEFVHHTMEVVSSWMYLTGKKSVSHEEVFYL
jgi:hypothetical protein